MDINTTIKQNTGLVYKQLIRFNLVDNQDAESASYEALYKAAVTFDANKGIAFSTYATTCIYNELCCYIRSTKKKKVISVVSLQELALKEQDIRVTTEILDTIPAADTIEEIIAKRDRGAIINAAIIRAYNRLKGGTHKRIIFEWALTDFTARQKDLSANTGASQPYVSTAINIFRSLLKEELGKDDDYE